MKTMIIVESPKKAKTFQAFLGDNYIVKSSFGHIRNLADDKNFGIEVDNNFKPHYEIVKEKQKQVNDIKGSIKYCNEIILASDLDREGEAIAWHLSQVFNLKNPKRIVFNNTTQKAVLEAIRSPRTIDMNIVNSQQARQILDKLVGYDLSPLLWKQIGDYHLSAGRVQSVATKLIIDREIDIEKFESKPYYKTSGIFSNGLEGELNTNFDKKNDAMNFLNIIINKIDKQGQGQGQGQGQRTDFIIGEINKKTVKRFPSAPFRTSTMQQEAGKKFGMSSKIIMNNAQVLYENGHITYHRTDCVDIAEDALLEIKNYIVKKFGDKYLNIRKYKAAVKSAQEAHECIRPINVDIENLDHTELTIEQKKLYEIIWKKTVSSQMSPCEADVYTIQINTSDEIFSLKDAPNTVHFICKAEKIVFDGYKRIYNYRDDPENADDNIEEDEKNMSKMEKNMRLIETNKIKSGDKVKYNTITSIEKFSKTTGRFTEPTLTKKMEDLGIGRPATTASIISTIQERKYVVKETRKGKMAKYNILTLEKATIIEKEGEIMLENEKNKIFPTELGKNVTNFLIRNFPIILDYKFTSNIENELDEIAKGNKIWTDVVKSVYNSYHPKVVELNSLEGNDKLGNDKLGNKNKRLVGKENITNKNIFAYTAKFGPVLQIGEDKLSIKFFPLTGTGFKIETITEKEANELLNKQSNILGKYNDKDVVIKVGKFGKYLQYDGKNFSIKQNNTNNDDADDDDNSSDCNSNSNSEKRISLDAAIKIITASATDGEKKSNLIKEINATTKIMKGQYGLFIIYGKKIVPLKNVNEDDSKKLTLKECKDIVDNYKPKPFAASAASAATRTKKS